MTLRLWAVVLLVVLAGCTGSPQSQLTTTAPATTTPTTTATTTTTTAPTTTTRVVQNPWGADPVTVAVTNFANDSRNIAPLAREAIAYWEGPNSTHGDYPVDYLLVDDASDAHIVIQFVEKVHNCGNAEEDTALGCAPLLTADSQPGSPSQIQIRSGYTDKTTANIIKHELGHTRGLEHGDEPMPTMAAVDSNAKQFPVTDAADRLNPWQKDTLNVYLSAEAGWSDQTLSMSAREAIKYYNTGADGWERATVTFKITESKREADIIIRANANDDLGFETGGYGWTVDGEQLDSDPALERYTGATLVLDSVRKPYGEWYVGALLGYSLGAQNQSDLPEPFAEPKEADESWFD